MLLACYLQTRLKMKNEKFIDLTDEKEESPKFDLDKLGEIFNQG